MKDMKENIDKMGETVGLSVQEGEEEEGYGTVGGDRISTFRTEMMSKGESIRPVPQHQESQHAYQQQ